MDHAGLPPLLILHLSFSLYELTSSSILVSFVNFRSVEVDVLADD